jgi:hypothetical protein
MSGSGWLTPLPMFLTEPVPASLHASVQSQLDDLEVALKSKFSKAT